MIPEWPCPNCGAEDWDVLDRSAKPESLTPVCCLTCRFVMTPHWVDGAWMGRWWEAGSEGALTRFVGRRSEELREYATITARGSGRV